MTFINYTNDGKAVIQPAALVLSDLNHEEKLELHAMDKVIVLLKPEMTPLERLTVMSSLTRLVNYLGVSMTAGWNTRQNCDDENDFFNDGFDEGCVAVPAEAFEDAGILHDNLRAFSTDGAVLIVSEDRKVDWHSELDKTLKMYGIDRAGFDKLMKAVMECDESDD